MATKSDEVLCININQQFPYVETPDDLYNVTRGIWRLDKERTEKARYLFSVYQGVIREVYEINECISATKETKKWWVDRSRAQGIYHPPGKLDGRNEMFLEIPTPSQLERLFLETSLASLALPDSRGCPDIHYRMRVFLTLQVTTAQDAHVMQFVSGNDVSQRANADIILVCLSVSQPLRFI